MAFTSGYYFTISFTIVLFLSLISCSILSEKEDESFEEDLVPVAHVLPKQIFNEGKPFYVDKDPISGQLDFSSKKPAGIEPEVNEVIDTQLKNVIFNSLSPNIHDYLNLPVKYSSSKFVYPLVSSSYANLKYQGNNKNFMSHNKEITASTTTSPKYYTFKKTTNAEKPSTTTTTLSTTTKTPSTIVLTSTTIATSSSTKKTTSVPTSTTQKKTTSTKSPPTTFSLPPTSAKTSTKKVTTEATTTSTTTTTTTKTTTTTERPSTLSAQNSDQTSTTKKLLPQHDKNPTPSTTPAMKTSTQAKTTTTQAKTTTTQAKTTTTQMKTTTTQAKTTTTQAKTTTIQTKTPPSRASTTTTSRPTATLSTTKKTTTPSSTTTTTGNQVTINSGWIWKDANNDSYDQNVFHPISTTERPHMATEPSAFKPIPTQGAGFSTMNPSAVYNELSHKKDSNKMSLMDLFNALAEEDFSYNPTGYENDQADDLSQRILSSQPAPFTLQKTQANTNYFNELPYSSNNDTAVSGTVESLPNAFSDENVKQNFQRENPNEQKEYVRYEIQQPTMVQQQYRPIPSANNVVILPDQNSASFVLGSQQSVQSNTHMGTVDKVPLFENVNYMSEKQTPETFPSVNFTQDYSHDYKENYGQSNSDWISPQSLTSSLSFGYNQESNQNVHNSKVKFPNEELSLRAESGLTNHEASQIPNQPQVSFPKDTDLKEFNQEFKNTDQINKVIFKDNNPPPFSPLDGQNAEQKKEILTLNKYNLQKKVNIPALAEDLTPPALPEFDQKMHQYPPIIHRHDEFTRKKFVPSSRPKVNHSLPNILPQFRPNAKISSGHSTYTKEPGNIRINNPKLRYPHRSLPPPPPPPSQYGNNRMPIGTRLNVKMIGNDDGNRRIFSVPVPTPPIHLQIIDRMFVKRPTISQVPSFGFNENYSPRKHFQPNMEPHRPIEMTEKLFMEDDQIVNDPPRQEMENEKEREIPKFEPVVTLQMLKTQKKSPTPPKIGDNLPNPKIPDSPQSPVYVVYPVQSSPSQDNMGGPVMMESKLEKRNPSPVDYSYSDFEYQNTPFTVQREQPQEPILMKVKDKPFLNGKTNFPYRLEKPDPQMMDRYGDSTFDIAPRIVNRDIERKQDTYMNTEIPIAVAYTPTEPPNSFYMNYNSTRDKLSSLSNNEFYTDDKNYEKDFMAPFFPSLSLGTITSAPNAANGWSIYSTSTEGYDKNYINRADTDTNQNQRPNGFDLTTKEFDPDRFQPELQGGFKPIYPPGYKIRDSDEESEEIQPAVVNSNTSMNTTTTTKIDTTTTTSSTTSKPTERKKSQLEASLESLLFGDDEDFDDDDDQGDINEKNSKDSLKS